MLNHIQYIVKYFGYEEICDFLANVPAGPCGDGEFLCGNEECVDLQHRCDGQDDCGDLSDEIGCDQDTGQSSCWDPDKLDEL